MKKLIFSGIIALAFALLVPTAFADVGPIYTVMFHQADQITNDASFMSAKCQHPTGFHQLDQLADDTHFIEMTNDPIEQPIQSGDGLFNWIHAAPVLVIAETRATRNANVLAA